MNVHPQVRRPIRYWPRALSAVIAGGALIATVTLTVAAGGEEASAQNFPMGGSQTQVAITQGPAPTAPLIPSAVPKHVQSWKCWDKFVSQC